MRMVFVAAISCMFAQSAFGYIDPGTGSALIQGLIAAVAAIGVTVKLYWHRILAFFGRNSVQEDSDPEPHDDSAGSE